MLRLRPIKGVFWPIGAVAYLGATVIVADGADLASRVWFYTLTTLPLLAIAVTMPVLAVLGWRRR